MCFLCVQLWWLVSCKHLAVTSAALPLGRGLVPEKSEGLQTVVTLNVNTFFLLWIQDLDNLIQDMDSDENKVRISTVKELL